MTPPRNANATTTPCPVCRRVFTAIGRQRYCSPACRQAAWRNRALTAALADVVPAVRAGHRRRVTVYQCGDCEQRYLGDQWCGDCNRPCTRIGIGGACPSCEEPVAVDELLDQHNDHLTGPTVGRTQPPPNPGQFRSWTRWSRGSGNSWRRGRGCRPR